MHRKTLLTLAVGAALGIALPIAYGQSSQPAAADATGDQLDITKDRTDVRLDQKRIDQLRGDLRNDFGQRKQDIRELQASARSGDKAGIAEERQELRQGNMDMAKGRAELRAARADVRADQRDIAKDRAQSTEVRADVRTDQRDVAKEQTALNAGAGAATTVQATPTPGTGVATTQTAPAASAGVATAQTAPSAGAAAASGQAALSARAAVAKEQPAAPGAVRADIRGDHRDMAKDRADMQQDRNRIGQLRTDLSNDFTKRKEDLSELQAYARSGNRAGMAGERQELRRDSMDIRKDRTALRGARADIRADRRDLRGDRHDVRADIAGQRFGEREMERSHAGVRAINGEHRGDFRDFRTAEHRDLRAFERRDMRHEGGNLRAVRDDRAREFQERHRDLRAEAGGHHLGALHANRDRDDLRAVREQRPTEFRDLHRGNHDARMQHADLRAGSDLRAAASAHRVDVRARENERHGVHAKSGAQRNDRALDRDLVSSEKQAVSMHGFHR